MSLGYCSHSLCSCCTLSSTERVESARKGQLQSSFVSPQKGYILMHESTLIVTPIESPAQPQTKDVSLFRAALFGAVVPPLLATAAFLLLRTEVWFTLPSPFFLLFMFIQMSLFVS